MSTQPATNVPAGYTAVQYAAPTDPDMVLTPVGYRHKSSVHQIKQGHSLDGTGGRNLERDETGKVVADHGVSQGDAGKLVPGSGPGGASGTGWICYADWNNNSGWPVTLFTAAFVVPPPPATASGQTIFIFIEIQNAAKRYMPVLQWGPSAAGGGNYWSVGSWLVDQAGGTTLNTTLTTVSPGTKLLSIIALTNQNGTLFNYECQFLGLPNTLLNITNVAQLTLLAIALEAFSATKRTDYPNVGLTSVTGVAVQTGPSPPNVVWTPVNVVTNFGQHVTVVSNAYGDGKVDIYY